MGSIVSKLFLNFWIFLYLQGPLAIIWNNYANNERLLIIKHGIHLYCSAEMITTSKLTAPKNKMAPVTCVVGRSMIPIYAMAFLDLR